MDSIHLQQTLPQVFADRNSITSDVWHRNLVFHKGKSYLIEAASGTGKSSLCSYIYGYRNDYQGIINFDETNIKAYPVKQWVEIRKHSLSMLFQDLRIFTELTAIENIRLKNNLTGYKTRKEVLSLFEALGLGQTEREGRQTFFRTTTASGVHPIALSTFRLHFPGRAHQSFGRQQCTYYGRTGNGRSRKTRGGNHRNVHRQAYRVNV